MTNQEQKQFIEELLDNTKKSLLKVVDDERIPNEWDGIELRWLVQSYVNDQIVTKSMGSLKRKREFNNHLNVNYIY